VAKVKYSMEKREGAAGIKHQGKHIVFISIPHKPELLRPHIQSIGWFNRTLNPIMLVNVFYSIFLASILYIMPNNRPPSLTVGF